MGLQSVYLPPTCGQVQSRCRAGAEAVLVTQLGLVIGYAAMGWFNRVQVAGTDQALVAEDEALRAGVAEASAAQVLAPRKMDRQADRRTRDTNEPRTTSVSGTRLARGPLSPGRTAVLTYY